MNHGITKTLHILSFFFQVLKNLEDGLSEDGSALTISQESRNGQYYGKKT